MWTLTPAQPPPSEFHVSDSPSTSIFVPLTSAKELSKVQKVGLTTSPQRVARSTHQPRSWSKAEAVR